MTAAYTCLMTVCISFNVLHFLIVISKTAKSSQLKENFCQIQTVKAKKNSFNKKKRETQTTLVTLRQESSLRETKIAKEVPLFSNCY